jgi:hypothetical protein
MTVGRVVIRLFEMLTSRREGYDCLWRIDEVTTFVFHSHRFSNEAVARLMGWDAAECSATSCICQYTARALSSSVWLSRNQGQCVE